MLASKALSDTLENLLSPGALADPEKSGRNLPPAQPLTAQSVNKKPHQNNKQQQTEPRPPKETSAGTPPPANGSKRVTWATVAATGINKNSSTQGNGNKPSPQSNGGKQAKTTPKTDDRIFLRVPPDHGWKKITAIGARQEVIRIGNLKSEDITYFQEVKSGFALRTKTADTRKKILALAPTAEASGLRFEEARVWRSFLVRGVPKYYTDTSGTFPTDALVPIEAQGSARSKEPPVFCRKAPFGETTDTCHYFISFGEEVRIGFKLFDCSAPAELRT